MMKVETSVNHVSVSDLLLRRRPLTGASSFSLSHSSHRNTPHKHNPHPSQPQSPISYKILKPLGYPTLLIGTLNLTLPSLPCSNPSCLKFSDDSAAVCCDILDLNLCAIGRRIRVDAWNFLPVKPHGGYLEIIRWSIDQTENISNPIFDGFYLHSIFPLSEERIVPRHLIYGLLNSVSPVTNVPCTANKTGTRNLNGFLADISVCECNLCCSTDRITLFEDRIGEQSTIHNFSKSKILYFCGPASVWYPAISRMVEGVVMISGMKKKMVFLGEERKSSMMYVTTDDAIIHLPMCMSKRAMTGRNTAIKSKGLCNSHTGSITGVYMHGMVIELDQKVLLLVDQQLSMPHSLRIGAIVTVRNFHLEDPKFSWTKVQIFGSCYKTSIRVNFFSPIGSGCYQALQSKSLLRKFIESLTFSSRLWVLLVVSSMRKKFAGVLSEMEVLGSKHIEGLVQKYSSSCLPLPVFRFRHGVLTEYCLHDLCECGKEIDYTPSKLVVPLSNLISQCEDIFIKTLYSSRTDSATNHNHGNFACEGKSHDQPIRKFLKSEDMQVVLLGTLKISEYSGRLQLIDATGSIDAIIPDLPSVWSVEDIYEINDFVVVMEGFLRQLEHLESPSSLVQKNLESPSNEPFSCRNIFNRFQIAGRNSFTIYICCYLRDAKSRNRTLRSSIHKEEHSKELETGSFHLLWLVHKFPVQQKIPGKDVISDRLSVYAEAVFLPWNIVLHKKERDLVESHSHGEKRCGISCLQEFPCTIDFETVVAKSMATVANTKEDSSCKTARKLLLEFKSDNFWKYELLRIGGYYMIKHHERDLVCTAIDKVFVDSKTHLWSVSFTTQDNEVQSIDSRIIHVLESMNGCPEIRPDLYLQPLAGHSNFLEIQLKGLKEDLIRPTNSIKGLSNSSWSHQTMMGASSSNFLEGNLLTVQGHVVAVHKSDQSRLATFLHHIVPGIRNVSCIHVLVDDNIVRIYSSLSDCSYPVGFGSGVKATFHRLLLTVDGNVLKLTPASFIEINSIAMNDDPCSNKQDDIFVKSGVETVFSLPTAPAALISEMTKLSDHEQIRLNCRVVAFFVLVLEKKSEFLQPLSTVNSEMPIPCVKFPLAGFVMDDGSSSCYCWTDNERVITLMGLNEGLHKSKKTVTNSTISGVKKILDKHGTIVMKNHGWVHDCMSLNVAVSGNSESVVSESDEQVLKSLVLQACSGKTWNVVGSVMESIAVNELQEWLRRVGMIMLPMQSIWASEVYDVNILNEGRSILQELQMTSY